MTQWRPLGKHRYELIDDLVSIECHGEVIVEEMQQILEIMEAVLHRRGRVLGLYDVHHGASIPAESRQLLRAWSKKGLPTAPTAVIGANAALRALSLLLSQAISLLTRQPVPVGFFKTHEEAHRWLAEQRQVMMKERGLTT